MKRICLLICTLLAAACTEPPLDEEPVPDDPGEVNLWDILHIRELRWNAGYVPGDLVKRGAFGPFQFPGPAMLPATYEQLWTPPAPAIKGYGAFRKHEVFAYVDTDGYTHLHQDHADWLVLWPNWSRFQYPIEEIELHPETLDAYALVRVGNAIQLYRFKRDFSEGVVFAQVVLYGPANAIFHNPVGNGYKSGAITFVHAPSGVGGSAYRLAFMSESTVYAHLGLVVWMFDLTGTTLTVMASEHHRTYKPDMTWPPFPGAGTGLLNIAFDYEWPIGRWFYFARDNGPLYKFDLDAGNNAAPQTVSSGPVQIVNDMGFWTNSDDL